MEVTQPKSSLCQGPPYCGWRVYGPYKQAEGRLFINVVKKDERRTISYPKFLMELHLGRVLDSKTEHIDHIDRDFTNNALGNLRIVTPEVNARDDAKRLKLPEMTCMSCQKPVPENRVRHAYREAQRKGTKKAGPFCSRACSGRYGKAVQTGKILPLPAAEIPAEFYRNDKAS